MAARVTISAVAATALALALPTLASASAPAKGNLLGGVGSGHVKEYTPTGALVQTLDTTHGNQEAGICFDASLNFYVTDFPNKTVSKFNASGTLASATWGTGMTNLPESCVVDNAGNVYVGAATLTPAASVPLYKFGPGGGTPTTLTVASEDRGSDHIDLAADNCTLFYTSEGHKVMRFNACTNTQLTDFAAGLQGTTGSCYSVRIRPSGDIMVACDSNVYRLDSAGNVTATFSAASLGLTAGQMFALTLDPDGTTFWAGDLLDTKVAHAQIAGGAKIGSTFNIAGDSGALGGLAAVGEIRAATPPPPPAKRSTSTTVSCSPNPDPVNKATTCTATVTDTDSGTKSKPTGTGTFGSSGSGSFSGSCASGTVNGSSTSCPASYTPGASGDQTITASYGGDGSHSASSGSTVLTVTSPAVSGTTALPNTAADHSGPLLWALGLVAVLAAAAGLLVVKRLRVRAA